MRLHDGESFMPITELTVERSLDVLEFAAERESLGARRFNNSGGRDRGDPRADGHQKRGVFTTQVLGTSSFCAWPRPRHSQDS